MDREVLTPKPGWLSYLVFSLSAAVYVYPFLRVFWGGGDEGTLMYGAVRVNEGQIPLSDFFEVMGPASFYWLALFLKLFGTNFLATRISIALTSISTASLLYFLARRLKTGYDALPAILFFATSFSSLWPANSHHNDSNLFALLSFTAFISWIDKRRSWILYLAGALAGVTTLCLQPKGLFLFLSFVLLVFLFRNGVNLRSSLARLTVSYLAVGLVVISLYWKAGRLGDLIYANVIWPLTNYSGVNTVPYGYGIQKWYWEPWTAAFSPACSAAIAFGIASLLIIPFLFVVVLPVMAILLGMAHRRLPFYSSALPYWIAGAALWLSEIHRKDIVHLVVGSPLLIIACLSCLAQARHGICLYAFKVICMSSIALASFNVLVVSAAHTKIASRRGTFYAAYAEPVLDFIDAHIPPGKEIFVYPYNPEYYFFSAGKNPTRFSVLMYHINTDAQFREAINSLEQHRVQYVIWGREFSRLARLEGWPAYSNPREEELIIEPYLNQKYRLLIRINGVDIMERRGDLTTLLQTSDGNKYHSQSDVKLSQAIHKALP